MQKLAEETVTTIRAHAASHPENTYAEIATLFGISEVSVKRYCRRTGRTGTETSMLAPGKLLGACGCRRRRLLELEGMLECIRVRVHALQWEERRRSSSRI